MLAGGLVAAAGTAEQRAEVLGAARRGQRVLAFAHAEPAHPLDAPSRRRGARPPRTAARWTAVRRQGAGRRTAPAPTCWWSARARGGGTRLFLVDGDAEGLTRTGYRTYDGGRAARVAFDGTPATLLGEGRRRPHRRRSPRRSPRPGSPPATRRSARWTSRCGRPPEYLKTRKQFGVTAQHVPGADLPRRGHVRLAGAGPQRRAVGVAGAGRRRRRRRRRPTAPRLQVSRAGRHIGQEAIQLHGGIGVTAEYSVGHYTSRLTALDHLLGDGDWALARLAATVGRARDGRPAGRALQPVALTKDPRPATARTLAAAPAGAVPAPRGAVPAGGGAAARRQHPAASIARVLPTGDWLTDTRTSYDTAAAGYADLLRDALAGRPLDRAVLGLFAELAAAAGPGPAADVGCGPGRITAHLRGLGPGRRGAGLSPGWSPSAAGDHPGLPRRGRRRWRRCRSADAPLRRAWSPGTRSSTCPTRRCRRVFAGSARVPRPGGVLVVASHSGEGSSRSRGPYGGAPVAAHVHRADAGAARPPRLEDHGLPVRPCCAGTATPRRRRAASCSPAG